MATQVLAAPAGKVRRNIKPVGVPAGYVTAITTAGGNTAVMVTYFHVALFGPARTWLMNLAQGQSTPGKSSARGSLRTLLVLTSSTVWRPTSMR
jgi:hypothetical protein